MYNLRESIESMIWYRNEAVNSKTTCNLQALLAFDTCLLLLENAGYVHRVNNEWMVKDNK